MRAGTARRLGRSLSGLGTIAIVAGLVTAVLPVTDSRAATTGSEVSVRWADAHPTPTAEATAAFSTLEFTVSQTAELTNQGLEISWTGGRPTTPGSFGGDFVQLMQCWADDPAGPRPDQCQWGAQSPTLANLVGFRVGTRDLQRNEDPLQSYTDEVKIPPPPGSPFQRAYRVPFESVDGTRTFTVTDYFDANTSNEVTAARTGADGTGSVLFELQTALEAPHLGCGGGTADAPRGCWLVIVPRGDTNLDGRPAAAATASGLVQGSPLSSSAWQHRLAIPLAFQPVSQSCPLGQEERRVVGAESIAAAMTSWQAALCRGGVTYGFSLLGDDEAQRTIVRTDESASRLAFVSSPLTEAEAKGADITYAPVVQTALVIAHNIDYVVNSDSPIASRNGTRVVDLVLNARLVAKLLTQSYRSDVPDGGVLGAITNNPVSIVRDPEFVRLNPEFAHFGAGAQPPGIVVALGSSDANALVWEWLQQDALARSFLAGDPDEWGARINSAYAGLDLDSTPTSTFPKADLSLRVDDPAPPPGYGSLDMRPYANDMAEAALRALRGDAGSRTTWDPSRIPASYVADGPQRPGGRFMIAIVDAPNAERFGLRAARLVNASGQAVAPSSESIALSIERWEKDEATGTRRFQPAAVEPDLYPLSLPVYAAINACTATPTALADYARLLDYAMGDGQINGSARGALPLGYVALNEQDAASTKATAAALPGLLEECIAGEEPDPVSEPAPTDAPTDFGFAPVDAPAVAAPQSSPVAYPEVETVRALDPIPAPVGQFGLATALGLGLPSLLIGSVLNRRSRALLDAEAASL